MIEVKVSRYDPRKDVSPHLETYKINKKEKMNN